MLSCVHIRLNIADNRLCARRYHDTLDPYYLPRTYAPLPIQRCHHIKKGAAKVCTLAT